jgi:hypothetical protein
MSSVFLRKPSPHGFPYISTKCGMGTVRNSRWPVYMYEIYSVKSVSIKYASWKKCLQKFCRRHPSLRVPSNKANTE